jgi:hypothetical protein
LHERSSMLRLCLHLPVLFNSLYVRWVGHLDEVTVVTLWPSSFIIFRDTSNLKYNIRSARVFRTQHRRNDFTFVTWTAH